MKFDKNDTAVVMIDPQNEVLSETGLMAAASRKSSRKQYRRKYGSHLQSCEGIWIRGFHLPSLFFPTDKGWKFNGPLETDEAASGMFSRKGVLNLDGLEGSGAD